MPQVKVRFSGSLDGHTWTKGEYTDLPGSVIKQLNPMTYRTRPLEAKHTRPLQAESKSDLQVVQAGAWWQVWDGEEKLKSFRSEAEAKEYAG